MKAASGPGAGAAIARAAGPLEDAGHRVARRRRLAVTCSLLVGVGLLGLAVWQLERRAWKHELIARVDARAHATAVPLPEDRDWRPDAQADEYRHVAVSGRWLAQQTTLVEASTRLGAGAWCLTPLRRDSGGVVMINRGFVARAAGGGAPARGDCLRDLADESSPARVTGLLRLSEPGGRVLRANDPPHERWYSRDVEAIAQARGLGVIVPCFIDADLGPASPSGPVAGMTVLHFPDNHLVYALTWFALALMSFAGSILLLRMPPEASGRDR